MSKTDLAPLRTKESERLQALELEKLYILQLPRLHHCSRLSDTGCGRWVELIHVAPLLIGRTPPSITELIAQTTPRAMRCFSVGSILWVLIQTSQYILKSLPSVKPTQLGVGENSSLPWPPVGGAGIGGGKATTEPLSLKLKPHRKTDTPGTYGMPGVQRVRLSSTTLVQVNPPLATSRTRYPCQPPTQQATSQQVSSHSEYSL